MISTKLKEVHSDIRGELYHMALETERNGFLLLGVFSYFCAVVGFCYTIINLKNKRKTK